MSGYQDIRVELLFTYPLEIVRLKSKVDMGLIGLIRYGI